MKKLFAVILCLILLLPMVSLAALKHVSDQAGTFSPHEQEALNNRMEALYEKYGFDLLIVTTNSSDGLPTWSYAEQYYERFRDPSVTPDGAAFVFNFGYGEYDEAARGKGKTILGSAGEAELQNLLSPYLPERDYYRAMMAYTDYVERKVDRYAVQDASGRYILGMEARKPTIGESIASVARDYLLYIAIAGLVIGVLVSLYFKSRLLIARPESGAASYVVPNSLSVYQSQDIYLYQTVTRTRIQENKSSGGKGGGGSSFGGGGGGYSHRGGKL
jgi:uncharacterized protein